MFICAELFSQVSFWVTREILNANTTKKRAEIISHFIRISKVIKCFNLYEQNPLLEGLAEFLWLCDGILLAS